MIREGVVEAFFNDVFTRQDPRGTNVYVIHARWHINDLIGVLSSLDAHAFVYVNLPALDGEGRALAPWLFSAEQLRQMRDTLGPYVWASLYQGSPRRRGGNLFAEPALAKITDPARYRIAIGIDLARTSSTRADHNAAVVIRKDLDTNAMDVLEAVRERGTVTDRVRGSELVDRGFTRELVRLLHQYPGAELAMYAMDNEMGFVRLLENDLAEILGFPLSVATLALGGGDKYLRAQPYAASWNKGRVRIPGRSSVADPHDEELATRTRDGWQSAFVVEHVEFTGQKGAEDDQVDAGAAAHDHLSAAKTTSLGEAMESVGRV